MGKQVLYFSGTSQSFQNSVNIVSLLIIIVVSNSNQNRLCIYQKTIVLRDARILLPILHISRTFPSRSHTYLFPNMNNFTRHPFRWQRVVKVEIFQALMCSICERKSYPGWFFHSHTPLCRKFKHVPPLTINPQRKPQLFINSISICENFLNFPQYGSRKNSSNHTTVIER